MNNLLTMAEVIDIEIACNSVGEHAAYSAKAMLHVLRSYRQAIAVVRLLARTEPVAAEFMTAIEGAAAEQSA